MSGSILATYICNFAYLFRVPFGTPRLAIDALIHHTCILTIRRQNVSISILDSSANQYAINCTFRFCVLFRCNCDIIFCLKLSDA